jgi:hypothetical protein
MRFIAILAAAFLMTVSCTKESRGTIHGTVINEGGMGYYLIEIELPSANQSFICTEPFVPPAGAYNCTNAIYITNMPAAARTAGTKIAFSRYKDLGRNPIWSSTTVPNDVEVYDLTIR